jgi:signal transduction histidine kinase/CheY-like chemotaxis protein
VSDNVKDILTKNYPYIFDENIEPSDIDSIEKITKLIENYYQSIISCMPGNIYWCDKNANGVGCNQNVLDLISMRSIEDFKGLSFEETAVIAGWSPAAVASFKEDSLEVIKSGKAKANIEEPPIPDQDGNDVIFLTTRAPLFNLHKNVIGMVGVSIDITKRKRAEAALIEAKLIAENADRSKTEFIGNMSHDIKTPLSGIIGMADLLVNRLAHEENAGFARAIKSAGQQLMIFFDNCLEIAKSESTDITLTKEHFRLRVIIQEIVDLFQPAIKNKGLELNIYYDDRLPEYLLGSRTGIFRTLMNLIGNAVKFTENGHISLSVQVGEQSTDRMVIAKFVVSDTGIGIPHDKHTQIFERFVRLTPSNKGVYSGSGLGLYLVKKMLTAMGGEIHVASEENKGSHFTVAIPLEIPLLSPNECPVDYSMFDPSTSLHHKQNLADKALLSNNLSSKKILLIEDNPMAQIIAKSILIPFQYDVDLADSGKNAIELFEKGKYHLVFMDIGLPDLSGYDITSHLRRIEEGSSFRVPIIALTAHVTEEIKRLCTASGIDQVTSKPLTHEQTKSILDTYLKE